MGLAKATITVEATGAVFPVLFNPEEYTLNQDNNFAAQAIPGLSGPILQFVHGNMRTLDMELFFDSYEAQTDVRAQTNQIVNLLSINSELHAPPVLRVAWASLRFRCVLAKASQKYILFLPDGTPVRAKLSVSFSEYIDPTQEAKQVNRQTANFTKVHIVQLGETLSDIAGRLYANPLVWRPIAIVNDIENPRGLIAGMELQIPPLPFTDPATGEVMQ